MAVDLELGAHAFGALVTLLNGATSALSPWSGANPTGTGADRARLTEIGLVDDSGARSDLASTLSALASPTAATTLRYRGIGARFEYIVWLTADRGLIGLSTTAKRGVLRLEDPAPTERAVAVIAGLVGRSPLRALELSLDLSVADGLALGAIVDAQRRMILSVLARGGGYTDGSVDAADLAAMLDHAPSTGMSTVMAVQRVCGPKASRVSADGLMEALASLVRMGLIDGDLSAVRLAGPCAELAQRFAAMTAFVELDNSCDNGANDLTRYGFACLQAAVSDLMIIESGETGIRIKAISADTVLGYIDRFLREPEPGYRHRCTIGAANSGGDARTRRAHHKTAHT